MCRLHASQYSCYIDRSPRATNLAATLTTPRKGPLPTFIAYTILGTSIAMHMAFDLSDVLHVVNPESPPIALAVGKSFIAGQHTSMDDTSTLSLTTRSTRVWTVTDHDFGISQPQMVLCAAWSDSDTRCPIVRECGSLYPQTHHRRMHFQKKSRSSHTVSHYGDFDHALTEVINGQSSDPFSLVSHEA